MPRWYVSALLAGIVTVSAVCLGLRWRAIELAGPVPTQVSSGATIQPLISGNTGAGSADAQPGAAATPTDTAPAAATASPADASSGTPTDAVADPAADAAPWGDPSAATSDTASPMTTAANLPATGTAPAASAAPPAHQYPAKPPPVRVNINSATVQQLQSLPGVGPVLAQRIADYRSQHGPFKTAAALQDVKGIGPKKWAKMQPWAYV